MNNTLMKLVAVALVLLLSMLLVRYYSAYREVFAIAKTYEQAYYSLDPSCINFKKVP